MLCVCVCVIDVIVAFIREFVGSVVVFYVHVVDVPRTRLFAQLPRQVIEGRRRASHRHRLLPPRPLRGGF